MENSQLSFCTTEKTMVEQLKDLVLSFLSDQVNSEFIHVIQNKSYIAVKAKHLLAVKIDSKKSGIRIEFKNRYDKNWIGYEISHFDKELSRITVSGFDEVLQLAPVISKIAESELVIAGNSFGCCGRYEACSDAKSVSTLTLYLLLHAPIRRTLTKVEFSMERIRIYSSFPKIRNHITF